MTAEWGWPSVPVVAQISVGSGVGLLLASYERSSRCGM